MLCLLPPTDELWTKEVAPIDFYDHEWRETYESVTRAMGLEN